MRPSRLLALGLALFLAGCDDVIVDTAPREDRAAEAASRRTGAAMPVVVARPATRLAAPSEDAAPVRTPAAAAPAAVTRVTGGNGPRRRIVEPDPPFRSTPVATLNEPWAMTFLPDGRLLVTQKGGALRLVDPSSGQAGTISGVPAVAYGGQGGLGDVILHPQYAGNRRIYLSYIERSGAIHGAVVVRARLTLDAAGGGHLDSIERIWEQLPKVSGQGHFSHRLAFDAAGKLWITSGDRQKFEPAQDMATNLGKII